MSAPLITRWSLLLALVAMWGSAFVFVRLGVATVPPATLVAGRITLAAIILAAMALAAGARLPPWGPRWRPMVVIALLGNVVPFLLISWAQQFVDSSLAGILISAMPLGVLVLAHRFVPGEQLNARRVAGFVTGFCGVVLLIGPAAMAGLGGAGVAVLAQLALVGAALCFAGNSVYARLTVREDFLAASAAVMAVAAAVSLPLALAIDRPWTLAPSATSVAAIFWLGVGPTAVASIVYFRLIALAGPSFMSLVNYLSPVMALVLGVGVLGEAPGTNAYLGLALILSGIAFARRSRS
jgi:drug/metabolite transporter (DMT)-like permease